MKFYFTLNVQYNNICIITLDGIFKCKVSSKLKFQISKNLFKQRVGPRKTNAFSARVAVDKWNTLDEEAATVKTMKQ